MNACAMIGQERRAKPLSKLCGREAIADEYDGHFRQFVPLNRLAEEGLNSVIKAQLNASVTANLASIRAPTQMLNLWANNNIPRLGAFMQMHKNAIQAIE